ncbi:MAG: DUF4168 domain-containing protein, partial [Phormidesmis sp.]
LNRIFFSQRDNLQRFAQGARAVLNRSLLSFLLAVLLGISAVLAFPDSSFSGPLVAAFAAVDTNVQSAKRSNDISTDKLDQFAQTYLRILKLLSDRQAELPKDETSSAAIETQQSIETDTVSIIQSSGLTLPEYMQILEMASQDEAFRRKIFNRSLDNNAY